MAALFCIQPSFAENATDKAEQWRQVQEKERQLYEHMARYGINRDDMSAMHRLVKSASPHTNPDTKILAEKVLKPGEHYRFELDEHILTMVVPDAIVGSSWIVPYADTRTDPEREAALKKSSGGLRVANLAWEYGTGIWPLFVGWKGRMNMTIAYTAVRDVEKMVDISTPEKLRQRTSALQKSRIPSPEKIADSACTECLTNIRIYLDAETIVINGRVWIREAMNELYGRRYVYRTVLLPDRWLFVTINMPQYDYNGHPDAANYPAPLKRAFAQMEAMVASLRVAKVNDDGAPDPFVTERVEPAPLPVREKLPSSQ